MFTLSTYALTVSSLSLLGACVSTAAGLNVGYSLDSSSDARLSLSPTGNLMVASTTTTPTGGNYFLFGLSPEVSYNLTTGKVGGGARVHFAGENVVGNWSFSPRFSWGLLVDGDSLRFVVGLTMGVSRSLGNEDWRPRGEPAETTMCGGGSGSVQGGTRVRTLVGAAPSIRWMSSSIGDPSSAPSRWQWGVDATFLRIWEKPCILPDQPRAL